MKSQKNISRLEANLNDNASMLSRFNWSTDTRYKKSMVLVFIFLIFLFLFRYPIIRWINRLPEPPTIDMGSCKVKGEGQLEIGLVYISPDSSSDTVIIYFSTNLPTNAFTSIQYGSSSKMEYESFADSTGAEPASGSKFPHSYQASFIIRTPGAKYYYRIACDDLHSETYSFYSWKAGSAWSPSIALVSGEITDYTSQTLSSSRDISMIAHIDDSNEHYNTEQYLSRVQSVASHTPFLRVPNGLQPIKVDNSSPADVFHNSLGSIDIISFDSQFLNASVVGLRNKLLSISKQRGSWLVLVSQQHSFCLPSSDKSACRQLFDLLAEFNVDLYVAGHPLRYFRSWPIAYNGDALSTYHSAHGFVAVGLGIPGSTKRATSPLNSTYIMRKSNSVTSSLLKIKLESPGYLCLDMMNSQNSMTLDHFCVSKRVAHLAVEAGTTGFTYDMHVWLGLVIVLSLVMLIVVVFRRKLYASVCRYMESDGGPPLYQGKLLSV